MGFDTLVKEHKADLRRAKAELELWQWVKRMADDAKAARRAEEQRKADEASQKRLEDEKNHSESGEGGTRSPAINDNEAQKIGHRVIDPLTISEDERQQRGEMLQQALAVDVKEGQIVASKEMTARKAAEKWWEENVSEPVFYDIEPGEVEINRKSIENSLAHRYSQSKLDAVTSLIEGFKNAVYLGSMPDFTRQEGAMCHYFAYPIYYKGQRCYVFCRANEDANKNRLYVHEVFVADKLNKKGNTLQTAASQPHGGITLYKAILENVFVKSEKEERPLLWERGTLAVPEDVATPTITTIKPKQGDEATRSTKGQSDGELEDKDTPSSPNKQAVPPKSSEIPAPSGGEGKPRADEMNLPEDPAERERALAERIAMRNKPREFAKGPTGRRIGIAENGARLEVNDFIPDADVDAAAEAKYQMGIGGVLGAAGDWNKAMYGAQYFALIAKGGIVRFADVCRELIREMGDGIRPYLKSIYNAARDLPGMEEAKKAMTPYAEVDRFDTLAFNPDEPEKPQVKGVAATASHLAMEEQVKENVVKVEKAKEEKPTTAPAGSPEKGPTPATPLQAPNLFSLPEWTEGPKSGEKKADGERVDRQGNPVDAEGKLVTERWRR